MLTVAILLGGEAAPQTPVRSHSQPDLSTYHELFELFKYTNCRALIGFLPRVKFTKKQALREPAGTNGLSDGLGLVQHIISPGAMISFHGIAELWGLTITKVALKA